MIWIVAWRNVWRNKLRSSVIITAVALGIFAGVFIMAFYKGMGEQRVKTAIKTQISHIQVHAPDFEKMEDITLYMDSISELTQEVSKQAGVGGVSKRLIVNAIINSAEKGGGIRLYGVDPGDESKVSDIKDRLIEGTYLEPLKRGHPIVIGKKLAEKLGVRVGSKLVVGLLNSEGQPVYNQFRVGGIFRTLSNFFDENIAFVRFDDLHLYSSLPEETAHEVAVFMDDPERTSIVASDIKLKFGRYSVKTWNQIMPELDYLDESLDLYMYIFILVILLALGFGIVNTMLMVVLERIRELGILKAVGMNRRRIFKMIMLETVFLTLSGGIIGIISGGSVAAIYRTKGIDLSGLYGEGFAALGYDSIIYTIIDSKMLVIITILVIIAGIISSIFPAIKALQLNPADAIRTDV
jgi:ABC-type lipoprotein release transport system permease subunit